MWSREGFGESRTSIDNLWTGVYTTSLGKLLNKSTLAPVATSDRVGMLQVSRFVVSVVP